MVNRALNERPSQFLQGQCLERREGLSAGWQPHDRNNRRDTTLDDESALSAQLCTCRPCVADAQRPRAWQPLHWRSDLRIDELLQHNLDHGSR